MISNIWFVGFACSYAAIGITTGREHGCIIKSDHMQIPYTLHDLSHSMPQLLQSVQKNNKANNNTKKKKTNGVCRLLNF